MNSGTRADDALHREVLSEDDVGHGRVRVGTLQMWCRLVPVESAKCRNRPELTLPRDNAVFVVEVIRKVVNF